MYFDHIHSHSSALLRSVCVYVQVYICVSECVHVYICMSLWWSCAYVWVIVRMCVWTLMKTFWKDQEAPEWFCATVLKYLSLRIFLWREIYLLQIMKMENLDSRCQSSVSGKALILQCQVANGRRGLGWLPPALYEVANLIQRIPFSWLNLLLIVPNSKGHSFNTWIFKYIQTVIISKIWKNISL